MTHGKKKTLSARGTLHESLMFFSVSAKVQILLPNNDYRFSISRVNFSHVAKTTPRPTRQGGSKKTVFKWSGMRPLEGLLRLRVQPYLPI